MSDLYSDPIYEVEDEFFCSALFYDDGSVKFYDSKYIESVWIRSDTVIEIEP